MTTPDSAPDEPTKVPLFTHREHFYIWLIVVAYLILDWITA